MTTIPVEKTIGDTYKFAFSNFLSLFGIAWLPVAIMIAAIVGLVWSVLPEVHGLGLTQPDAAQNQEAITRLVWTVLPLIVPLELLVYFLFAMIMEGTQRKALGLIQGPVFVYFSLGGAVWRMFGAMIAAMLLIIAGCMATGAAVALIFWFGSQFHLPLIYGLVEFAAVIAGIGWFFYMTLRIVFFVPPAVVAEGGFGIARSWRLSYGNFWPMAGVFLACAMAPMIALSMISNILFTPFMMEPMMRIQEAANNNQTIPPAEFFAMMKDVFRKVLPYFIAYEIITVPILFGLQNAMSAFAYRNITRSEIPA
jgi:hypothetical protein